MSGTITLAAPPTTAMVAAQVLSSMAAESGVVTDYNRGSQIRTLSEAMGSAVDEQSTIDQALAFQAIIYAGFALYGITPLAATYAIGFVAFTVATGTPATQPISIAAGTLVQTTSGVQYVTTASAIIATAGTSVTVPVQAVVAGSAGNTIEAGPVTTLVSGIAYPLTAANVGNIVNGVDSEAPSATLARFTAKVLSIGLGTPVAIANGVIGVTAPGTSETVMYATVYEAWVTQSIGSQVPGFAVYVDNGAGGASSGLLSAVTSYLNGSFSANQIGNRPAGVPFTTNAVTSVLASVTVTATLLNSALSASLGAAVQLAVTQYFASLNFGVPAELSQIIAVVSNTLAGNATSLTVALLDTTSTPQQIMTPTPIQRMLLTAVTPTLT